jgi:hypothetical protein
MSWRTSIQPPIGNGGPGQILPPPREAGLYGRRDGGSGRKWLPWFAGLRSPCGVPPQPHDQFIPSHRSLACSQFARRLIMVLLVSTAAREQAPGRASVLAALATCDG